MADDSFYGATLEKAGATVTWENLGNTKEFPSPFYKLVVRQILLGHTANETEYNTVEVETPSVNETVKVPIAVLKAGESRSVQTLLEFPDAPVTFKLVEGNGPVYIHGQQVPGNYELEGANLTGEDEEDGEEEDDEDEENAKENCKNTNNKKNKKTA